MADFWTAHFAAAADVDLKDFTAAFEKACPGKEKKTC